jgi:hypothetical protein
MERLGFFMCVADMEDELIRALGADAVERVLDSPGQQGDSDAYGRVLGRSPRSVADSSAQRTATEAFRGDEPRFRKQRNGSDAALPHD